MTAQRIAEGDAEFTDAQVASFAGDSWWRYRAAQQTGVISDDSVRDQAISVIFAVMDDLRECAHALRDCGPKIEIETLRVCSEQLQRLVTDLSAESQCLALEADVLLNERKLDAQRVE